MERVPLLTSVGTTVKGCHRKEFLQVTSFKCSELNQSPICSAASSVLVILQITLVSGAVMSLEFSVFKLHLKMVASALPMVLRNSATVAAPLWCLEYYNTFSRGFTSFLAAMGSIL